MAKPRTPASKKPMPPKLPAGVGVLVSVKQLSEETGQARDTISRKLGEANVQPAGERRGSPLYRLRTALLALYQGVGADGVINPDKLKPGEQKQFWDAQEARANVMRQARDLFARDAVRSTLAHWSKLVAQAYDTIPDLLERDCGINGALAQRVEKALNQSRKELANAMRTSVLADLVEAPEE